MQKTYQLTVSLLATVLSLVSMVLGIILTNSVQMSFSRMVVCDAVFVLQFLSILWCGLAFYGNRDFRT